MGARIVAVALLLLAATGCRDFNAAYRDCLDGGRCESGSGGAGGGDAGPRPLGADAPALALLDGGQCFEVNDAGACWEAPLPFGWTQYSVYAVGPDEAWFVGEAASVAHFQAGVFTSTTVGTMDLVGVAGDGSRVLAVSSSGVFDLVSGASGPITNPNFIPRSISALRDGGFVVGGMMYQAAGPAAPMVQAVDDALGLHLLHLEQLSAEAAVLGCVGEAGALVCSVGFNNQGRLWRQSTGWSTELDQAGATNFYGLTQDQSGLFWIGSDSQYFLWDGDGGAVLHTDGVGNAGRVLSVAAGDVVSMCTDQGLRLRCDTDAGCVPVSSSTLFNTNGTSVVGDTQFFAGNNGAMSRYDLARGLTELTAPSTMPLNDLWLDDDGQAWAALGDSNGGALWHRTPSGWQVQKTWPVEVNSVARVAGTLFVTTYDGLWQQLPSGDFHAARILAADGGLLAGAPGRLLSVRPVGQGAWAVGVGQLSLVFRGGADGGQWWQEHDIGPDTSMAVGHIVDLGAEGAVAVGHDGASHGVMLGLSPDGASAVLDAGALDVGLSAATRLPDGRVLACTEQAQFYTGTPRGGFSSLVNSSTQPVPSCFGLWVSADGGIFNTTRGGLERLDFDPLDPRQLEVVSDYPLGGRPMTALAGTEAEALVGGGGGVILRFRR